eukprot:TRINITY_DN3004_c0_g3_i1.p2 TRINITY_DN3004_c0_g3~~TRINITY_DN3004_c0_g3_i1.p2  ORF type:complete len:435 (+),score=113.00 TRINITY_DN3004_c0_g3_i1:101-1405(+)
MLLVRVLWPRFLVLEILILHFLVCGESRRSRCRSSPTKAPPKTKVGCPLHLQRYVRYPPIMFSAEDGLLLEDVPLPGEEVIMSCPGGKLRFNKQRESLVSTNCGSSENDTRLIFHDSDEAIELYPGHKDWKTLTCTRKILEETRTALQPCGPVSYSNVLINIGWASSGNFSPQFSVCHNIADEITWYSNHTIKGSLESFGTFEKDKSRPSYFKEGSQFFTKSSASTSYKLKTQKNKLLNMFGPKNGYFSVRHSFYLARGHLTPDGDFDLIHNSLADATYHYINVVPQWQSFNNGNWKVLEASVRLFASLLSEDLNIYTGTYGVLELTHSNGTQLPMYLGENKLIPVPEIVWKLVHASAQDEAMVFLGVNNPFLDHVDPICHDLCEDTHWNEFLGERRFEIKKGYLYCCSYQSVKKVIPWLPDLGNPYILQNKIL